MKEKYRKVPVEGITAEEVLVLWRVGKLYYKSRVQTISEVDIKNNVRAYVSRLYAYVTPAFRDSIDELWEEILYDELYLPFIIPNAHTRKCRNMNKNGIMRLVGGLRSLGVYQDISDSMICGILEQRKEDCSYRAYLSKQMDDKVWNGLKRLREIYMESSF